MTSGGWVKLVSLFIDIGSVFSLKSGDVLEQRQGEMRDNINLPQEISTLGLPSFCRSS